MARRIKVSKHAIERAEERVGDLWFADTQGEIDISAWVEGKLFHVLRRFGMPPAGTRCQLIGGGLLFNLVTDGETIHVLTVVRAEDAAYLKTKTPSRGRTCRGRTSRREQAQRRRQLREWDEE